MKKTKRIVYFIILMFMIIFINSVSFAWGNADIDSLQINQKIGDEAGNDGVGYWSFKDWNECGKIIVKVVKDDEESDVEIAKFGGQATLNGSTYDVDVSDPESKEKENIFCIQRGKALYKTQGTVKFIVKIKKDGVTINSDEGEKNYSYSHYTDDEITNIFKMAYILNNKGDRTRLVGWPEKGVDEHSSEKQEAIWQYTGAFVKALEMSMDNNSNGETTSETLEKDAEEYAKKALKYIKNGGSLLESKSKSDDVKLKDVKYQGADYIRVGPFKYSFTNSIDKISLTDENDNDISDLKFGGYNGNEFIVSDSYNDIIKSDENFWILISKDKNIKKINKLSLSTAGDMFITGKLCYIESASQWVEGYYDDQGNWVEPHWVEYQNIMTGYAGEVDMNCSAEMELNIDITGSLEIQKTDLQSQNGIPDVQIQVKRNSDSKWVISNSEGEINYIGDDEEIPERWHKTFTTDENGKILINGLYPGEYTVTEINNPNSAYVTRPQITKNATIEAVKTTTVKIENQRLIDISILKIDQDSKTPLANVKFKIKRNSDNKYIKRDNDGNITYVDEQDATEFYTDKDGNLTVKGITIGEYTAIELENPNKGYEKNPNATLVINAMGKGDLSRETIKVEFNNKRTYIDLSGYVWKDIQSQKNSIRNDLYRCDDINNPNANATYDTLDVGVNGIKVSLKEFTKDGNGNIVKDSNGKIIGTEIASTVTSELGKYNEIDGGEYVFSDVKISELSSYYIEYEFNGLTYQSVTPHIDVTRGSKAIDDVERKLLDESFASINSTGKNEVSIKNSKNTEILNMPYTKTQSGEATPLYDDERVTQVTNVHANTKDANYQITYTQNDFKADKTEITNINLGIYEKEQADLALLQGIENADVAVNGYNHIYRDHSNTDESQQERLNVGVRFKDVYANTYKRPIYQADYEFENPNDRSKELQVYLTYKITLIKSEKYITKVNSIVDYFDSRYELVAVGTGLSSQDNSITGVIDNYSVADDGKYKKAIIQTDMTVGKENKNIYIQFKLNREAVKMIINNKETLNTLSEINSYTVYKENGKETVAVVDKDSVPGNAIIGEENVNTYEDDTDVKDPVKLKVNNARKITGTVFVDSATGELKKGGVNTGKTRQGNGIFDNGEETVSGVKVTLHELNNSIPDMDTYTNADGNYEFNKNIIPGQYTITYTWGNEKYMVQYYKGTIYDSKRDQNNKEWYKDAVDTRKTDAIDNYEERKAIDSEVAKITKYTVGDEVSKAYKGEQSAITITKMNSVTPTMEFGVEYESTVTDSVADKVEFIVKNVDFGIVERAKQQLDLQKRVSNFKVTLANGQVLADATVTEDGKLEGTTNHMIYRAPKVDSDGKEIIRGLVKLETDEELIEGATLNITYEIKAINQSEVDYMSENYYKYGIISKNDKIATLTPSVVIDYLDKNLAFEDNDNKDENGNSIWKQISQTELQNLNARQKDEKEYLDNKKILSTDKMKNYTLKPTEKTTVELKVSKLLSPGTDMTFYNDAEVAKITSNDGKNPPIVPPTYPPVVHAEDIIIVPSTGANMNYALPTIVGIVSLVILGIGVFVIKKKIIEK